METRIVVRNEFNYKNIVDVDIKCERNIDEIDAKTIHEAANTIIEVMAKYMPSEKQEQNS
jgi:hypothetical protein